MHATLAPTAAGAAALQLRVVVVLDLIVNLCLELRLGLKKLRHGDFVQRLLRGNRGETSFKFRYSLLRFFDKLGCLGEGSLLRCCNGGAIPRRRGTTRLSVYMVTGDQRDTSSRAHGTRRTHITSCHNPMKVNERHVETKQNVLISRVFDLGCLCVRLLDVIDKPWRLDGGRVLAPVNGLWLS